MRLRRHVDAGEEGERRPRVAKIVQADAGGALDVRERASMRSNVFEKYSGGYGRPQAAYRFERSLLRRKAPGLDLPALR